MLCGQEDVQKWLTAIDQDSDSKYLMNLEKAGSASRASVVLRVDCTADDILDAYVHAYLVIYAEQPLVGCLLSLHAATGLVRAV